VLLELEYLFEIKRLMENANNVWADLAKKIGLQICRMPFATVMVYAVGLKWTRDPFDRLIVASAVANNNAPLISADRTILENYKSAVW
jgi:PIN domain nuclease of toxin-antitoxin system